MRNTLLCLIAQVAYATAQVNLGTANSFGALGQDTVTNSGLSLINGDVGTAGTSITGFPPGVIVPPGSEFTSRAAAGPLADAILAYNQIVARTGATTLPTAELGGLTLSPGTYKLGTAQITGTLTLNGTNSPSDAWYFQIASTLTTASNSKVNIIQSPTTASCNVWWQVGTSATLGTNTNFIGPILALASVSLNTGANATGGLFGLHGAVTLLTNNVSARKCPASAVVASMVPSTSSSNSIASTTATAPPNLLPTITIGSNSSSTTGYIQSIQDLLASATSTSIESSTSASTGEQPTNSLDNILPGNTELTSSLALPSTPTRGPKTITVFVTAAATTLCTAVVSYAKTVTVTDTITNVQRLATCTE